MKRYLLSVAAAALAVPLLAHSPASAQGTATPPPAPPLPSAQATYAPTPAPTPLLPPGALATPAGNNATVNIGGKKASATPAPPKDDDNRVGISGVWEVAIQRPSGVEYTHFKLTQTGTVLTGTYLDGTGKKYPLSGTIDGKNVKVIVTLPGEPPLLFSGSQDGGTDMVGTIDTTNNVVGFTAEYRPKYKWIDNLSPGTGGIGNPGGGVP